MKKLNKWEKTFKELGINLSSYKPTATTTKCKHYSRKEELKQLEQFSVSGKKKGKK